MKNLVATALCISLVASTPMDAKVNQQGIIYGSAYGGATLLTATAIRTFIDNFEGATFSVKLKHALASVVDPEKEGKALKDIFLARGGKGKIALSLLSLVAVGFATYKGYKRGARPEQERARLQHSVKVGENALQSQKEHINKLYREKEGLRKEKRKLVEENINREHEIETHKAKLQSMQTGLKAHVRKIEELEGIKKTNQEVVDENAMLMHANNNTADKLRRSNEELDRQKDIVADLNDRHQRETRQLKEVLELSEKIGQDLKHAKENVTSEEFFKKQFQRDAANLEHEKQTLLDKIKNMEAMMPSGF
ncbi:hypothetical protein HOD08_01510 [bacterium]|nr:hypothetical protein [bacterium]